MCGIFGHSAFDTRAIDNSREALMTLAHRGPDQWGEWYDDEVYLGHRRLSILDTSEQGRQPMVDHQQEVIITVNGEVYNFKDLREELRGRREFKSSSDSEVILHGYREWGIEKLLRKIDGMYAFTIYDRRNKKIYIVRDRVGIKPLFYLHRDGGIVWASELKALEKYLNPSDLKYDNSAIYDFLVYRYVPTPKTLYKDICKLEPAHYLEIDLSSKNIKKRRYWEVPIVTKPCSVAAASEQLKALINKSVKEQMVSDVPLGFFLSGGMDSSVVVAEASNLSDDVHTFSIGFDVAAHSETHFAKLVADQFSTKHFERILNESNATDMYRRLRDWYDEPFADTSAFPSYLVSKFAREQTTVALTGDGGDEIFGGYKWYRRFLKMNNITVPIEGLVKRLSSANAKTKNRLLKKVLRRIRPYGLRDESLYNHLLGGSHRDELRQYAHLLGIPDDYDDYWYIKKYYRPDLPTLTRLQYLDFHTFLHDDILTKLDRVSMAVSLEARVPLLSKDIVEYAFSLPEEIRFDSGRLKGLLKRAYQDILPEEIIGREKKGFSVPAKFWRGLFDEKKYHSQSEQILSDLFPVVLAQAI